MVSITSYYYTQKSRIWQGAVCGVNHVILLHTEINDNMLASRLLLHNIYYRCKDQGENLQIIVKFSYLAKYDINIASYQSRNRFSFLCLYRVVIIWIISKILWKINNKHVEINQYNLKPVYNRHSREPENVPFIRVPEKCRFCRIGRQKYVKSDKNWFFVGLPDQ